MIVDEQIISAHVDLIQETILDATDKISKVRYIGRPVLQAICEELGDLLCLDILSHCELFLSAHD